MLIAQLTDIHIGFEQGAGKDELNYRRYRTTLDYLLGHPNAPDLLLLTGDLTEHGDAGSYELLAEPFTDSPFPVYPMAGNHDAREELRRAFPDCPQDGEFVHYVIEREGLRVICLDTFEPGRHGGAFCDNRAQWLADQLAAQPDTPTLIFMHHPPVISGIDWMDPSPDEAWIDRFGESVAGHTQIAAIRCGHLHRPFYTSFRGIPLSVTPSVAPTIALDLRPVDKDHPDQRDLVSKEPPGYALHRWHDGQLVTHHQFVGDWKTLATYEPHLQPMMFEMFAERE